MTKSTLVLFDFDGTIADIRAVAVEVANEILTANNRDEISIDDFEELRGKSAGDIIKYFKIPITKIPAVVTAARQTLKSRMDDIEPVPGMLEFIKWLSKQENASLVVLTSNSQENVEFFLKKYKIYDAFDDIHANVGLFSKYTKIRRIAKAAGSKVQVVSIGDETRDVDAARIAKVPSIAVDWGLSSKQRLQHHKPDTVVSSVDELKTAVSKHLKG